MRTVLSFNNDWLFLPEDADPKTADSAFERITLPHTNKIFPHHNFDNLDYQFISTYRKRFDLPEVRNGRRVFIDFDGAMISCEVFLNGQRVGENDGGYTPFSFDITDLLNEKGENLLTVRLDSTERPDIPPYGHVVDYLTFGGIYRDVKLRYVETCYISDIFVKTSNVLTTPSLEAQITVTNLDATPYQGTVSTLLQLAAMEMNSGEAEITVPAGEKITTSISLTNLQAIELWSLENPTLYALEVSLKDKTHEIDKVSTPFGFREAHFSKDGSFYLNGGKLKLIGLNRHQTYPYIGAAAPARLQRKDADIVKYELGCNIVRTSHYPQSPHFLQRCDEIGLLVFEEIPGWQHIGDKDWQGISLRDVEAMILRDRNHPSIILWGVRINESQDDEAFYTATNALAHQLDSTRQTGGVRYLANSQFLEDVYTYNDFSNSVIEPTHTPHFVTEFNGHMFPTKTWDQEERQIEHGLRHARVQDKQLGMNNVVGAIGWCAFDYNTHREFGSGDRICYHGVMDTFRLPKYAASFYESQIPPEQRPILRAATMWSMGDRSGGGNDPLVIFSNCDEIEVYIGTERFGCFQPDRENFPHLPHPPYQIPGLQLFLTWGQRMSDLQLIGYVKGEKVTEQWISSYGIPHTLELKADDSELQADGADMTRLIFRIVDQYGNRMSYATQQVMFEIDGPAELIGENPFALIGGQAAMYIKARHEAGTVTVRATSPRLQAATVSLTIRE